MVCEPPETWNRQTDVVVIGSGTGLSAALSASEAGAEVLVLEKSPYIGGTTAVSGGGSWAPNSKPVVEAMGETPKEDLMTYLRKVTGGRTPENKLERFVDREADVFDTIDEITPLEFIFAGGPSDYHAEFEGGSREGRMIVPDLYDGDRLGEKQANVRESPHFPLPVTFADIEKQAGSSTVFATRGDFGEIAERMENNLMGGGTALIAGLYEALLNRGVEFELESPAKELVRDGERIVGVIAEIDGEETYIQAASVIIAAGGLEWDEELRENFLPGPLPGPASTPYNEGDGIKMGAETGAKLGNMSDAFWFPTHAIPGETWEDGSPLHRLANSRQLPGCIVVNKDGRRFGDETTSYNDFGKTLYEFDPHDFEFSNVPAFEIMDHGFRSEYAIEGQVLPEDDLPEWVTKGETIDHLAEKLGIDPNGLKETIETYNEYAAEGRDPEFHSGELPYSQEKGDPEAEHPNLAPLDEPPYYGVEIQPGTIGTKGGLVTDVDAAVLNYKNESIPGLYASSNSAAHIMGLGYAGGGATVGPNIVFGWIAGENAAKTAREEIQASN
jgi:succinate dehydrogenase/fumarate reductase flavoprotein subunit